MMRVSRVISAIQGIYSTYDVLHQELGVVPQYTGYGLNSQEAFLVRCASVCRPEHAFFLLETLVVS